MDTKQPTVYIITNKKEGALYTGVTSNLSKRIYEHKNKIIKGFTTKYNCRMLVYYEVYDDMEFAIHREKRIKKYRRLRKIQLIESLNPEWKDLYNGIC